MSTDRDVTRIVRSWLQTDEQESADRVLDAVLDRLDTTPQRRAMPWPVRRFPTMNKAFTFGIAAAVVVLVAFLGLNVFQASNVGDDSPAPDPTPVPARSAEAIPLEQTTLSAGTYTTDDAFAVPITFDVPSGWIACAASSREPAVCAEEARAALSMLRVENVFVRGVGHLSLPNNGQVAFKIASALAELDLFETRGTPAASSLEIAKNVLP